MILHNLIIAVRNILKHKTQNLISILGLSVALLCFSICLYCTRYIYSTNQCFENLDRLVQMSTANKENGEERGYTFCDFNVELEKLSLPEVETYIYTNYAESRPYNIEVSADKLLPYTLVFMETQPSYYQAFKPQVLFGSWEQAAHAPNSVVLAESTAKQIFGEATKAIGKQMYLTRKLGTSPDTTPRTGGIAYTIQAVVEDLPENTSLMFLGKIDAWVMNDSEGLLNSRYKRSMMSGSTYALLKEGTSREDFIRKVNAMKQEYNLFGRDQYLKAHPFDELFWKDSSAPYFAVTTLVAGILILLVGMLNFFHFLVGSYITRIREYSLRQVNGAKGYQLWNMLMVQATLSLLLSGLFTMMMMELLTPFLSFDLRFIAMDIDRPTLMQQAGTYLLGLWVCCMLAAAFVVWRVRRITILKGLFGGGGVYGRHRVRNVLLGVQMFICWIFFSCTVALYLQSHKAGNAILNTLTIEEKENIFSIPMREYTFLSNDERKSLVEAFSNIPGTLDVLPGEEPFTGGTTTTSIWPSPERKRDTHIQVSILNVAPNFFEFMNMPIQAGTAHRATNEMVVSDVFEKNQGKEVMGQTYYNWDQKGLTVTGISVPLQNNIMQRRTSLDYEGIIRRLASHGFVVVATSESPDGTNRGIPALDWLAKKNTTQGDVLYGKLDMTKVGASGHSMGGLQSEKMLINDKRVITAVLNNSGAFNHAELANVPAGKTAAIVYGEGGMERPNAEGDYNNNNVKIPACLLKMTGGQGNECQNGECGWGHGSGPWGGMAATVAWMRWHLGGETFRKDDFVGSSGKYINGAILGQPGKWKGQCKNF